MLVKPLLASHMIVDGTLENSITFICYGGDQYVGNDVEIYNNTTGIIVVSSKTEAMTPKFIIPKETLINGTEYRCRVRTFDRNNVSSEWSDYMIINCLSSATISITNIISGVVKNQKYVFTGEYVQQENVLLKSFTYLLYDNNKVLLKQYPTVYQTSGVLQQMVEGMDNNSTYHIELKCIDQYNQTFTTGLIQFSVEYKPPKVQQVLHLENNSSNASIDLSSEIIQLIFETDGEYSFIDDEEIALMEGKVYLENIDIYGDFSMQIWVRNMTIGEELLRIDNKEKRFEIVVKIEDDYRVHVYKRNRSITSHYSCDGIDATNTISEPKMITSTNVNKSLNTVICGHTIYVQQIKGRIGIEVGVING